MLINRGVRIVTLSSLDNWLQSYYFCVYSERNISNPAKSKSQFLGASRNKREQPEPFHCLTISWHILFLKWVDNVAPSCPIALWTVAFPLDLCSHQCKGKKKNPILAPPPSREGLLIEFHGAGFSWPNVHKTVTVSVLSTLQKMETHNKALSASWVAFLKILVRVCICVCVCVYVHSARTVPGLICLRGMAVNVLQNRKQPGSTVAGCTFPTCIILLYYSAELWRINFLAIFH